MSKIVYSSVISQGHSQGGQGGQLPPLFLNENFKLRNYKSIFDKMLFYNLHNKEKLNISFYVAIIKQKSYLTLLVAD